jgi:hypothetical protein
MWVILSEKHRVFYLVYGIGSGHHDLTHHLSLRSRVEPFPSGCKHLLSQRGTQLGRLGTPTQDVHGRSLAERVLHEQGIALIAPDHLVQPTFGMQWDEGIVLCSGATDI